MAGQRGDATSRPTGEVSFEGSHFQREAVRRVLRSWFDDWPLSGPLGTLQGRVGQQNRQVTSRRIVDLLLIVIEEVKYVTQQYIIINATCIPT